MSNLILTFLLRKVLCKDQTIGRMLQQTNSAHNPFTKHTSKLLQQILILQIFGKCSHLCINVACGACIWENNGKMCLILARINLAMIHCVSLIFSVCSIFSIYFKWSLQPLTYVKRRAADCSSTRAEGISRVSICPQCFDTQEPFWVAVTSFSMSWVQTKWVWCLSIM